MKGKIDWFDPGKGFGFAVTTTGGRVFVHFSELPGTGFRSIEPGTEVTFDVEENEKGPRAKDIKKTY